MIVISALQDKKLLKAILNPRALAFDCTQHNQDYDHKGFCGQENEMGDALWRVRHMLISIASYAIFYIYQGILIKYWAPGVDPSLVSPILTAQVAIFRTYNWKT